MSGLDTAMYIFAIIGLLYCAKIVFSLLLSINRHFLRCEKNLSQRYGSKIHDSSWVAITGATGSLGFSYCKQWAQRGFNIVMIARNPDKADKAMSNLKKLYPNIETSFIQCDLGELIHQSQIDGLKEEFDTFLESHDIAVLVNVAGIEIDDSQWGNIALNRNLKMMSVNMFAPIIISQLLLPYFEKRCKDDGSNYSCIM